MNASTGKRIAWGICVAAAIFWTLFGYHFYKATRPKPVVRAPLTTVGVGVFLGRNQETRQFEIRRVFPNSPAEKAGLTPGLILNKVGDVWAEQKNIKELSKLLTGPVGSKVVLEVADTNGVTTKVEVTREPFLNRSKQNN